MASQTLVLLKKPGGGVEVLRGAFIVVNGVAMAPGFTATFDASHTVIVNHNLGRYPASVRVCTLGGQAVDVATHDVSVNQTRLYFDVPIDGTVEIL